MRELTYSVLFASAARTSSANGTGVDLEEFANPGALEFKAILDCGAASGTSPTLDVKIQESDSSGSGYADISGAAFTQLTTTGNQEIHFQTSKRYVRAVATIAGTTPSFTFGTYLIGISRTV